MSRELARGAARPNMPLVRRPLEGWGWFNGLCVHSFAEGSGLWLNGRLPARQCRFGLFSAGVELPLQARECISLSLDVGWPVRDVGIPKKREPQLHASGAFEF